MNKTELARKIQALEGLDNEEKTALLDLLRRNKKYGLVWEEKPEDIEDRLRDELPVLIERNDDKVHSIISDNPEAPNHLIIEGDNLAALTELSYTHAGKIDVIYIDPPYNRGKKDFKYNDNYIDEDNPFRHSLWLCFMSKRLKIAKHLLSPTGIIVCHIDEHEFDALNMLLSEIFGASNSLGQIIWNKMNPKGDAHAVSYMHEYILLYSCNRERFNELEGTFTRPKLNAEKILAKASRLFSLNGKQTVPQEITDTLKLFGFSKELAKPFVLKYDLTLINSEFQKWLSKSDFTKGEKAYKYIHPNGRVFRTVSMAWPNKEMAPNDYWIPLKHPITNEECPLPSKGWRFPPASFKRMLGDAEPIIINDDMIIQGEIVFTRKRKGQLNIPERIYWLDENMNENVPSIYEDGSSDESLFAELGIKFEYPKTVSVGQYVLSTIYPDANIVLDFFAGSGTALHAVMAQNSIDSHRRTFIGVTNNENNICEDVTYSRLSKAINGYTKPNGDVVPGLTNNNLRYYRTEFLPRERSVKNMRELVQAATGLLCIKNDNYTEAPFGGRKMNSKYARFFDNGKQKMLIIYEERAIPFIADIIKTMPGDTKIMAYVFSHGSYAYNDEFADVADKVELCALPQAIYDAYQKVLPKRKPKFLPEELVEEIVEYEIAENQGLFSYDNETEKGGEA